MKTFIVTSLFALSLIAASVSSANAFYDGYPDWAQDAFDSDDSYH